MGRPLPVVASATAPIRPATHVVVGSTCNLGCEGCAKLPFSAASRGAPPEHGPIVITGGEPMLERDLIARIRALPGPVWLETNGALLHSAMNVRRLAAAGLAGVRLFLPGWDEASSDRVARVDGIGRAQQAAAQNVLAAGLDLAFVMPIRDADIDRFAAWLERAERLAASRRDRDEPIKLFLSWTLAPEQAPGSALELSLARLALAAVRRGVIARFDGPLAPSPCRFRRPEAFASLFAGPTLPRAKPEDCTRCPLDGACAGPRAGAATTPLSHDGRPEVAFRSAVDALEHAEDVQGWIRAGASHRWGRENFVSIGSEPDIQTGGVVHSALLRAFYHCNQNCTFCWVDLQQPRVPDATIAQTFALMGLEGMKALSITGGEPTLDKRLESQVRLARALGIDQVTLQTNAVRLDAPGRAQRLADAGLTRAFVSLHGADENAGEAVTRAPGTFERTVRGIQNLLAAGVSVGAGVVFTYENAGQAREIIELVATRLRGTDLTLSVAAPINDRLDVQAITPRYSEVAPALREAARAARELGVPYAGLFGQCGLPPCILDADPVCFPELAREHPEWSAAGDFVHAEACEGCSLRRKCPGVRASYAAAYGVGELQPVVP